MSENRYTRLEQMQWWRRDTVAGARALIAGCGALGNEVLKNLLLLGWGRILLVDFDKVSASNLARSILFGVDDVGKQKTAALLRRAAIVNPDCQVLALDGDLRLRLSAGLVARTDVVFGCLDNVQARLALSGLAGQAGTLYLDGGLSVWEGTVSAFLGEDGPCYACGLTADDLRELNLRRSCPAYAARAAQNGGVPTTPTMSSMIAAQMVQIALKHIHGSVAFPNLPRGRQLRFDTAHERFWNLALPRNPECPLHPVRRTPLVAAGAGCTDSWGEIFAAIGRRLGWPSHFALHLPLAVLEAWQCPACGMASASPRARLTDQPIPCPRCGAAAIPTFRNQITGAEGYLDSSPAQMEFPPWLWVTAADAAGREEVFELGCVNGQLSPFDRSTADAFSQ